MQQYDTGICPLLQICSRGMMGKCMRRSIYLKYLIYLLKRESVFVEVQVLFIRAYQPSDCMEIMELFYRTVHTVNAKDYTAEQLNVWATGQADREKWNQSFCENDSIVAVEGKIIVGFGDIDRTGYLDRLYVHKDYQRKGIATAICNELEGRVHQTVVTHASITARPFFEKRGYQVLREQQIERQGIFLKNFIMGKERQTPIM